MRRIKKACRLRLEELESRTLLSTFYVAPIGNDGGAGSSQAPWQTLQHAANAVQAGDTVIVEPGNYQGFELTTSGAPGAPITFQAQAGVNITSPNAVTGQDGINLEGASYVVIDGFTITNMPRAGIRAVTDTNVTIKDNTTDHNGWWGIFTGFSNYVDIEHNTASNSQIQHGIYVSNSAVDPVIRNNLIYGNAQNGIHLNGDIGQGGTGVVMGALIEGNVIHDNGTGGGSAINGDGVQNSVIDDNLLYNNHASGISLYQIDASQPSTNNVIANNTIVMASDARWALNIQNASTGNVVFNNILYNNNPAHGSIDVSSDSLPGLVSDDNVVNNLFTPDDSTFDTLAQWQAITGQDTHSIVSTPAALFVNAPGNDYHLAAGSPAIGAGVSGLGAAAAPVIDVSGAGRSGYDIGSYAYQTTTAPTSVPVGAPPVAPPPSAPTPLGASNGSILVTSADAGGGPEVKVYDAKTAALKFDFFAYAAGFTGGVRVAVGDVNGDGVPDIITAPGAGGGPDIHVYDGRTGDLMMQFFAFSPNFTGGVYVAAADVNADGHADIIIGAGAGGGPQVRVFSGTDGSVLDSFFAYDPRFTGGVRVAAGDINADGYADIICGAGAGGGPNVSIFSGRDGSLMRSFFAFDPSDSGGVYVAAGDVNGDGRADVIAGSGDSAAVAVYSGADGSQLEGFNAYNPAFSGGVRVAAVDRDGDGKADVITVAGTGGGPDVRTFSGGSQQQIDEFFAYSPLFSGGLYVASGQ